MPLNLFNGLIKKEKEMRRRQYRGKSGDIVTYESQDEAEDEFLKGNLPENVYNQLEL